MLRFTWTPDPPDAIFAVTVRELTIGRLVLNAHEMHIIYVLRRNGQLKAYKEAKTC